MNSQVSEIKTVIVGACLTMLTNYQMLFIGEIAKALFLGAVGAVGAHLVNKYILKK